MVHNTRFVGSNLVNELELKSDEFRPRLSWERVQTPI